MNSSREKEKRKENVKVIVICTPLPVLRMLYFLFFKLLFILLNYHSLIFLKQKNSIIECSNGNHKVKVFLLTIIKQQISPLITNFEFPSESVGQYFKTINKLGLLFAP